MHHHSDNKQNGPKMDPKWTQNGLKMDSKWTQNGPKMDPKWTQNGPKMDPKWTQNGPKMDPKWTQNGPKMDPKWTQNGPKMDTELDTHINAFGAWHTYKRGSPRESICHWCFSLIKNGGDQRRSGAIVCCLYHKPCRLEMGVVSSTTPSALCEISKGLGSERRMVKAETWGRWRKGTNRSGAHDMSWLNTGKHTRSTHSKLTDAVPCRFLVLEWSCLGNSLNDRDLSLPTVSSMIHTRLGNFIRECPPAPETFSRQSPENVRQHRN